MNATTMDMEKLKGGIREAFREALAEKEEENRLSKVEELLGQAEATINGLADVVTQKEGDLASISEDRDSLAALVEELKTKAAELEAQISVSSKETEDLEERASLAEKKLADIEAEKRLTGRMVELDEAKVALSGEKREAQSARICEMSDEAFVSYKEERVELRSDLEAQLKSEAAAVVAAAAGEGAQRQGEENGEGVIPADLDKAYKATAAAAAAATLNIEVVSEDLKSKYREMAENLAKYMDISETLGG